MLAEGERNMSIDHRTRRHVDVETLSRDQIFDSLLPEAADRNGHLAARGIRRNSLGSLAFEVDGRALTLREGDGELSLEEGSTGVDTRAALGEDALSDLVQDVKSAMGLAMNARAEIYGKGISGWVAWEPVFRALFDGRPVYENGSVEMLDRQGRPLELDRAFTLDDDRDELAAFFQEAGFLHIRGVFTKDEMEAVAADLDAALAVAEKEDGASWWAANSAGVDLPVRILYFQERSALLRELLADDRLQWLAELTGDGHKGGAMTAEGLIKPLDIVSGLSDLPWHKDCGQGGHSYLCNSMTVGISVTGASRRTGALGVVPGSHRANIQTARLDPNLDLAPRMLETQTGDITIHCSDTLHRSHRPEDGPRKVVYTGFRLPPKQGDRLPELPARRERSARAALTDVRSRIAAADHS
jgi:hypothetical protein